MEVPDRYSCGCGAVHRFSLWVYAHWEAVITHVCGTCRRRNRLRHGRVISRKAKLRL